MKDFLSGASMLGSLTIGLFFLRFWKKTNERLFMILAIAFWLFAVERVVLLQFSVDHEGYIWAVYLIRLFAFSLIIFGIVDKNRARV